MQRAPALGLQAPRTLLSIDPKAQGLSRQGTPQAIANPSVCCILACCSTACTERCEPGRKAACAVPAAGGASSPPSSPRLPRAQGITQYLMVALDPSAPGLSVAVELLRGCRERGSFACSCAWSLCNTLQLLGTILRAPPAPKCGSGGGGEAAGPSLAAGAASMGAAGAAETLLRAGLTSELHRNS